MMLGYSPLVTQSNLLDKSTKDLYTSGILFYQNVEVQNRNDKKQVVPGVSRKVHKQITCYVCDNMGHYANDYPT